MAEIIALERPEPVPPEVRPFERSADEAYAERVMDGIVRLCLPLPYSPRGTVNAYLLEQDAGWCLVDCGTSVAPGWDALEHALGLAGVETRAVELLVCTHAHADHYGLAAEVMERCGCPLATRRGPTASAEVLRDPVVPLARRLALAHRAGVPYALAARRSQPPRRRRAAPAPRARSRARRGCRDRDARRPLAGRPSTGPLADPGRAVRRSQRDAPLRRPRARAIHPVRGARLHPGPMGGARRLARASEQAPSEPAPAGARTAHCGCVGRSPRRSAPRRQRRGASGVHRGVAAERLGGRGRDPRARGPFYPRQAALSGAICMLERLVNLGTAAAEDGKRRRPPLPCDRRRLSAPASFL